MKTIKVSEATERQLDWLVARLEGDGLPKSGGKGQDYSTNWAQGGPIKEKHQISTTYCGGGVEAIFNGHYGQGPTELIATMRCYVASKLGNTAEVPGELV